jgi:nucleoside 2-deoxyribosyltransferase
MKISICGSMTFYKEMIAAKTTLEARGHAVFLPKGIEEEIPIEARTDLTQEEIISAKIEFDFMREHFRKIQDSDAILVLNYDKKGVSRFIGGNTFLEMGLAFWLEKKIYLLNEIPDTDYKTEMHAMQPVVLNGDLSSL